MPAAALNAFNDIFVALQAGFFCDAGVPPRYSDFIREMLRCESQRMEKAVKSLGRVFGHKPRRRVAIIANSHLAVAS
ncbi:MAG TPA: hypothetical protein VER03_06265, partial [Bryobacteraceae bacterium]|nr:hypothetical protein [Bryobacteraceae bacterium]